MAAALSPFLRAGAFSGKEKQDAFQLSNSGIRMSKSMTYPTMAFQFLQQKTCLKFVKFHNSGFIFVYIIVYFSFVSYRMASYLRIFIHFLHSFLAQHLFPKKQKNPGRFCPTAKGSSS